MGYAKMALLFTLINILKHRQKIICHNIESTSDLRGICQLSAADKTLWDHKVCYQRASYNALVCRCRTRSALPVGIEAMSFWVYSSLGSR